MYDGVTFGGHTKKKKKKEKRKTFSFPGSNVIWSVDVFLVRLSRVTSRLTVTVPCHNFQKGVCVTSLIQQRDTKKTISISLSIYVFLNQKIHTRMKKQKQRLAQYMRWYTSIEVILQDQDSGLILSTGRLSVCDGVRGKTRKESSFSNTHTTTPLLSTIRLRQTLTTFVRVCTGKLQNTQK